MADPKYPVTDAYNPAAFDQGLKDAVKSLAALPIPDDAKPGMAEVFGAAFRTQNVLGAALNYQSWRTDSDNGEALSGSEVDAMLERDKLGQHRQRFGEVYTREKYDATVADIKSAEADNRILASAGGVQSLVASLGAGLLDPTNLIPVGNVANKVDKAAKLSGIQRAMINGSAAGAAGGAANEAGLQALSPVDASLERGVNALGAGVVLGGLFGAGIYKVVGPDRLAKIEARMNGEMRDFEAGSPEVRARVDGLEEVLTKAHDDAVPPAARERFDDVPEFKAPTSEPSIVNLNGMGAGITDNLYSMLWTKVEAGDVLEAGGKSNVLVAAKIARERGGLQTETEFRAFAREIADHGGELDYSANVKATIEAYTPTKVSAPSGSSVGAKAVDAEVRFGAASAEREYIDHRLLGISIDKLVENAPEKLRKHGSIAGMVGEAIVQPRMVLQRSQSVAGREIHSLLDDGTYITHNDVVGKDRPTTNVMNTLAELRGQFATEYAEAERVWRDAKAKDWKGKEDEFNQRVSQAMVNGDKDVGGDVAVEAVARHLRRGVYDPTLKIFQDTGILDGDANGKPRNAGSYLPMAPLVDVIRSKADRFNQINRDAFNEHLIDAHTEALLAHRHALEIARTAEKSAKAEVRPQVEEALKQMKVDHTEALSKARAEARVRAAENANAFTALRSKDVKNREAIGRGKERWEQQIKENDKRLETEVAKLEADYAASVKAEKAKVTEAGKQARDKALAEVPEYDRAVLNKWGRGREDVTVTREKMLAEADTQAMSYYKGITGDGHSSVVLDHEFSGGGVGLRDMLQGRKGRVAHAKLMTEGFVETNPFRLAENYHRKAGADAALARAFKRRIEVEQPDGTIEAKMIGDIGMTDALKRIEAHYKNQIDLTPIGTDNGGSQKGADLTLAMNRELAAAKMMRDFFRGTPTIGNSMSMRLQQATPYLMGFNSLRLMGGTVASSLGDPANLIVANGLGKAMKSGIMPAITDFNGAVGQRSELAKLNKWLGASAEYELNSAMAVAADNGAYGNSNSRGERMMEKVSKAFWKGTGLVTWTAMTKNMAANVTHARIIDAAEGGWGKLDKAEQTWLTNLGISEKRLAKIKDEYDAQPIKGFGSRGDMKAGDPRTWKDEETINVYRAAVFRESNNVIVTPTHADKLALQSTPHGQLIMQFRNFGVAAQAKVLARNAALSGLDNEKATGFYTGLLALVAMGVVVEGVKATMGDSTLTGASKTGGPNAWHRFSTKMTDTPGELVYNVLDRSVPLFHVMEVSNMAHKVIGFGGVDAVSKIARDREDAKQGSSRMRGRGAFESMFGPSVGLVETGAKVGKAAVGWMGGQTPTRGDFGSFRSTLPFQNAPVFQQFFNTGDAYLGDKLGWPAGK
jgi:hypothetical protein